MPPKKKVSEKSATPVTPVKSKNVVSNKGKSKGKGKEASKESLAIAVSPDQAKENNSNVSLKSPEMKAKTEKSKQKEACQEPALVTPQITSESKTLGASSQQKPRKMFGRDVLDAPRSPGMKIPPRVTEVYRLIKKSTGALGGNGYDGAIYGELTMHSMQRVVNFMKASCDMDHRSRFIDVGAGLGKPNFHASQDPAVRVSIGIELEEIRWKLSMHNLNIVLGDVVDATEERVAVGPTPLLDDVDLRLLGGTNFMVGDIDEATTMDPFTHIYMFDLGFPPPLQQSIARKFNTSIYARWLVSYRPPHRVIEEYGYAVDFVHQLSTSMHGSGENHTAYFYKRANAPAAEKATKAHRSVQIAARLGFDEEDAAIFCDKAFAPCVELAAGKNASLQAYTAEVSREHMEAKRPVRERKPRIL